MQILLYTKLQTQQFQTLILYKVTANKIQLCFISTQNWTNLANIKLWVYKEYRFCSTKMECQYLVFSKKASTQTLQLIVLHLFTLLLKKKLHSRLRLAEKSIKICNKQLTAAVFFLSPLDPLRKCVGDPPLIFEHRSCRRNLILNMASVTVHKFFPGT